MISSPDDQLPGRFAGMASDRLGYLLKHVLAQLTEAQVIALAHDMLAGDEADSGREGGAVASG